MTIEEAQAETFSACSTSYGPERNWEAIQSIRNAPVETRIGHIVARLFFRGIYFPQMNKRAWLKLLFDNRRTLLSLIGEGLQKWAKARRSQKRFKGGVQTQFDSDTAVETGLRK